MDRFFDIFIGGGVFCSFLASLILFFSGRRQQPANRLLAGVLMVLAWFVLQSVLVLASGSPQLPASIRSGYPVIFLALPLAYLYVRRSVSHPAGFRKSHWGHFIPAAVGLADWGAYYIGRAATPQNLLSGLAGNHAQLSFSRTGLLPAWSHLLFLPVQALVYLVLLWGLLWPCLRPGSGKAFIPRIDLANWLLTFTGTLTLVFSGLVLGLFVPGIGLPAASLGVSAGLLLLSAGLFFKPEVLYGISSPGAVLEIAERGPVLSVISAPAAAHPASLQVSPPDVISPPEVLKEGAGGPEAEVAAERTMLVSPEQVAFYAKELRNYLIRSEIYRRQGISINELAVALQIPARQLSYVINQHYQQRFNDLINSYRVDYIIDRLHKDDWRALTLEGLAADAGFSSRSTFFTAFKKATTLNPTQFLQQMAKMAG